MNPEWCSRCRGDDDRAFSGVREIGVQGRDPKQDQLDRLCKQLGIPSVPVGVGGSFPSHVFESAARQCGISERSMPQIGQALAKKAGLDWTADCDSGDTLVAGRHSVTQAGLDVMSEAVAGLLPRR
jgi:hypothetical protein